MFKVPIIPPDLRHEETVTQAAYALDCLQTTIVTIFGRIDKRIEKNNFKVKELQERIQRSQAKINSLQGTRKAIHIYAPARFPASNVYKDLPVTFEREETDKRKANKYQVGSKLETNLPNLNEKLIFFHVREQNSMNQESLLTQERCNIKQIQDLGNMPYDLRSVPSVFLFNTDYSVYDMEDGDSESQRRSRLNKNKRQQQLGSIPQAGKQILEPAPHSLAHRRNEKLTPSGGLKYTPKLSEAPELDLPLDLPDLPGIADDLRYESQEAKQKIAPSLALVVDNLPDLKDLIKDNENETSSIPEVKQVIQDTKPPPPPPMPPISHIQQTPPPPPPPPSALQSNISQKTPATKISNSPDSRSQLMAAIRNAGGNVKSHLRHNNNAPDTDALDKTSSEKHNSPDSRSELMAAIRNAGTNIKAHLRHTAAAPIAAHDSDAVDNTQHDSVKNLTNSRFPQGGDLMADLHNKLLMRRKGISGSKDNANNSSLPKTDSGNSGSNTPSGNPVISRLSALIPPPPPSTKHSARNTATTSDEDDSNDTDWVD